MTFRVFDYKVKAPVRRGDEVGCIEVYKDGVLYKKVPAVSAEDVAKSTYVDRLKQVAGGWSL